MKVIGITGGTGSGKTTALNVLLDMGAYVIDCDALYHELLRTSEELLNAIERRFPGVVVNGALDRKRLGEIVFGSREALSDLNAITHPIVEREMSKAIERERKAGREIFAIDAIALLEGGMTGECDVIVGITAPKEQRIRRVMEREGVSEEYARLRVSAQKDDEYYREKCDAVLCNDGTREEFETKCREYFESIVR